LSLSLPIVTGGVHIPVMSESNGTFRLLTRPIVFTEKVPGLGTVGDIGLYDFSQYVVGMRAEFQLAKSQHAGFANDKSYYRGIIRVDGQPKLSAPITPFSGDTALPVRPARHEVVMADRWFVEATLRDVLGDWAIILTSDEVQSLSDEGAARAPTIRVGVSRPAELRAPGHHHRGLG